VNHKVARFRQIDMNDPHVRHDAAIAGRDRAPRAY
jgi:hypothetical protein